MCRTCRRRPPRETAGWPADRAGVTLVEMLVALAIMGIVLAGVAVGLVQGMGLAGESRLRAIATSIAAEEVDRLRSMEVDLLEEGLVTSEVQRGTMTFVVRRQTQWVTSETGTSACTVAAELGPDGEVRPSYLRVDVEVSWPFRRPGTRPVLNQTVITPPLEVYAPDRGHLAVRLTGADDLPVQGVEVTVDTSGAGTEHQSRMTDDSGCAFFGYLPPGEREVRLHRPGFVDPDGDPAPVVVADVRAPTTTPVLLRYDQAAEVRVEFVHHEDARMPAGLPLSFSHPDSQRPLAVTSPPPALTAVAGLFPFRTGYEVWVGCADNRPGRYNATTPVTGPLLPGITETVTVELPSVRVRAADGLPGIAEGGTLTLRSGSSQDGCATPVLIGATPTGGAVSLALNYGPWSILYDPPDEGEPLCAVTTLRADEDVNGDDVPEPVELDLLVIDGEGDCVPPDPDPEARYDLDVRFLDAQSDVEVASGSVGTVVLDPPPDGDGLYAEGTAVTMTAVPDEGWRFAGWSGDVGGSQPTATVLMIDDRSVTASFDQAPQVTLEVRTEPDDPELHGPGALVSPAPGAYSVTEGSIVPFNADHGAGWRFSHWERDGAVLSETGRFDHVVEHDQIVTAVFTERSSYEAEVMLTGPLHWWRMEDVVSDQVPDDGAAGTLPAQIIDPGRVEFVPSPSAPLGQAVSLSGEPGSRLEFGTVRPRDADGTIIAGADLFDGSRAFSLEAWVVIRSVLATSTSDWERAGVVLSVRGQRQLVLTMADGASHREALGVRVEQPNWRSPRSTGPLTFGRLYHVVATYDPDSGYLLYLDGVEVGSGPTGQATGPIVASNQANRYSAIGAAHTGTNRHLDALIDEVAIYDRTLSAEDVARHHAAGVGGP